MDRVRAVERTRIMSGHQDWDQHNPKTWIAKGYIDSEDDVAFRIAADAASCFGKHYRGLQRAYIKHPKEPEKRLWFPKVYKNSSWNNRISVDGKTIWEINESPTFARAHIDKFLSEAPNRIVFVHVLDPFAYPYRFKGEFELDRSATNYQEGLVWRRVSTRVQTYPPRG